MTPSQTSFIVFYILTYSRSAAKTLECILLEDEPPNKALKKKEKGLNSICSSSPKLI